MLRQSKEEIANAMPRRQTPVNEGAVITIEEVFLVGIEGKAPADLCACGKYAIQNHVTAKMHVLMTVKAGGFPAIQAREFLDLGGKHFAKSLSQKRIVDNERVFVSPKKSANPLLIQAQRRRDFRSGETLGKIDVQSNIETRSCCQRGCTFRVLHEYHRTGRADSIGGKAHHDSICSKLATAKIVSVYGEHELKDQ